VIDAASAAPIASALVEVRGDSGDAIIRRSTDRNGNYFIVLPAPGRYHLRFAAIGYIRQVAEPLDLESGVRVLGDVRLDPTRVELTELVTTDTRRGCRTSPEAGTQLSRVLEAAAEALRVMRATVESGALRLRVESVSRTVLQAGRGDRVTADSAVIDGLNWPIEAGAAQTLEIGGFASLGDRARGQGWVFHGPDADVLFSPWFLESHCFDASLATGSDTLVIAFRPARTAGDRVDISGRLLFDARTLVLHRMEFSHENLPRGMPRGSVGGEIRFARTSHDTWLPVEWMMRAPISGGQVRVSTAPGRPQRIVGNPRVIGRRELVGRILP
jgi:hypothetical protein